MSIPIRADLVHILRETLKHLEQTDDLSPNDPTLIELKRHIVRVLAELKIARNGRASAA